MKRLIKICGFLSLCLLLVACPKDDAPEVVPPRPHADVYPEDLAKIETYLKTHALVIQPGAIDDGDLKVSEFSIEPLDTEHTVSIWDQTEYPLLNKIVKVFGVDFKVYYLKLDGKTDTEADGEKPTAFDEIFFSYRGTLLDGTQFDYAPNPVTFDMYDLIRGWHYIIPEFRAGYFDDPEPNGTLNPRNYGSGVMFLPSGLAYYSNGQINVPSYSPLVFAFNLYSVTHLDHDGDGFEDRYEYVLNDDGTQVNTDGDNLPDSFDSDDDNDGFSTYNERKYKRTDPIDLVEHTFYYSFNGAATDDPLTLVDERGMPDCDNDQVTPTRIRKHLDATCH